MGPVVLWKGIIICIHAEKVAWSEVIEMDEKFIGL